MGQRKGQPVSGRPWVRFPSGTRNFSLCHARVIFEKTHLHYLLPSLKFTIFIIFYLLFLYRSGEPLITISSSPSSHKLPTGATINLTCTAWQNKELAMRYPKKRPHRIEWFEPQDKPVGNACQAGSPAAARMKCTLIVDDLTEEKFGNYTCKASNDYNHCSSKRFQISFQGMYQEKVTKSTAEKCYHFPLSTLKIRHPFLKCFT